MSDTKVSFTILKASLLVQDGHMDYLILTIDAPTAFPEMKYPAQLEMKTRCGYGEEYCITNFGIRPTLLKVER